MHYLFPAFHTHVPYMVCFTSNAGIIAGHIQTPIYFYGFLYQLLTFLRFAHICFLEYSITTILFYLFDYFIPAFLIYIRYNHFGATGCEQQCCCRTDT